MIRSTLSISAGLAVVAVVLTSLWIGYGPRPQSNGQEKRAPAAVPLSQQSRSGLDANGQAIRTITPGSSSSPGMVATAPKSPTPAAPTNQAVNTVPPAEPSLPERPANGPAVSVMRMDGPTGGANGPSATATETLDLNTATVEQLNALGAGMIGKRIIEFRPYTSTEDLITRRVLKRADYDSIKAAITVR
jgi:DNA uptake protein ComE-like DNA-binding protein